MLDKSNIGDPATVTNPLPKFLTVEEVAELFRCSTKTIYRRVASGKLPAIEEGGRFLFNITDIRAVLIAKMVRPKSQPSQNAFSSKDANRPSDPPTTETDD